MSPARQCAVSTTDSRSCAPLITYIVCVPGSMATPEFGSGATGVVATSPQPLPTAPLQRAPSSTETVLSAALAT